MNNWIPQVLKEVNTLEDAKSLLLMDASDRVLCAFSVKLGYIKPEKILWRVVKSETDLCPILQSHICMRCEHALQVNKHSHHLLVHVPMNYKDHGTHTAVVLDHSNSTFATICGNDKKNKIIKDITSWCDNCSLHYAPMNICPKNTFSEKTSR